jgi:hypothetical protein
MTPKFLWKAAAPIICALMTASCAGSLPISTVAPVRLSLPEAATRPCALAVLPAEPTAGDLDAAYVQRGAQILACDGARRLAVETLLAERALQEAQALEGAKNRP